ncbi:arginine--tRNA ligase [Mucilaginibacter sp. PAMB04274]|uniref:arginine--tRNA ligase n=1 Tax=Mucilaginibacter sp. PAMB04274 TaxID=3138568 RepID=UPI0031F64051
MDFIIDATIKAVEQLYQTNITAQDVNLQQTRKEFEGQVTIVTFPFTKFSRKSPEQTGQDIGAYLQANLPEVAGFNILKGFLNISIADVYWLAIYNNVVCKEEYGVAARNGKKVMVEYSSPNTNKPLHLGHVRNNLLGYSVAAILDAAGYEVIKTNLVNDRGIHICKSMLAWQMFGDGETPQSSGLKGDHLVGKYYVIFDKELKKQVEPLLKRINDNDLSSFSEQKKSKINGHLEKINLLKSEQSKDFEEKITKERDELTDIAKSETTLMKQAQQMLQKWEAGDEEVIGLWKTMNGWVYEGFATTYKKLGVDFDKYYYESNTYLLGKDIIEEGLTRGVFFKKEDGSVWIDLTEEGLDQKLVLRADGTSVYITQDLGTAQLKYNDFGMDESIYVVGNEQDYHFKVLFLILQKLGKTWAKGLFHLSYGMVDLPSGKMKSREGTVVDADDLIAEMEATAKEQTEALGKTDGLSEADKQHLYYIIGMGALKYFLLKVDPRKRLLFDPNESVDFQGHTGPFIQYTHARIKSVLSRVGDIGSTASIKMLDPVERDLIITLSQYQETVTQAAKDFNPAAIANYIYELAKAYNKFYHEKSILQAETEELKRFRSQLSASTANVIAQGMRLLGIEVPERM